MLQFGIFEVGETKNKLKNAGCKFGNPFIFDRQIEKRLKTLSYFRYTKVNVTIFDTKSEFDIFEDKRFLYIDVPLTEKIYTYKSEVERSKYVTYEALKFLFEQKNWDLADLDKIFEEEFRQYMVSSTFKKKVGKHTYSLVMVHIEDRAYWMIEIKKGRTRTHFKVFAEIKPIIIFLALYFEKFNVEEEDVIGFYNHYENVYTQINLKENKFKVFSPEKDPKENADLMKEALHHWNTYLCTPVEKLEWELFDLPLDKIHVK